MGDGHQMDTPLLSGLVLPQQEEVETRKYQNGQITLHFHRLQRACACAWYDVRIVNDSIYA